MGIDSAAMLNSKSIAGKAGAVSFPPANTGQYTDADLANAKSQGASEAKKTFTSKPPAGGNPFGLGQSLVA